MVVNRVRAGSGGGASAPGGAGVTCTDRGADGHPVSGRAPVRGCPTSSGGTRTLLPVLEALRAARPLHFCAVSAY